MLAFLPPLAQETQRQEQLRLFCTIVARSGSALHACCRLSGGFIDAATLTFSRWVTLAQNNLSGPLPNGDGGRIPAAASVFHVSLRD